MGEEKGGEEGMGEVRSGERRIYRIYDRRGEEGRREKRMGVERIGYRRGEESI